MAHLCRCCKAAINSPEGDGAKEAACLKLDEHGTDSGTSLCLFCARVEGRNEQECVWE